MNLVAPNSSRHTMWLRLLAFLAMFNLDEKSIKIEEGQLIIREFLSPNHQKYSFDLRVGGSNSDKVGEVRIPLKDSFYATRLGIAIQRVFVDPVTKEVKEVGNTPFYYHPDPNFFRGNSGTDLEAAALECIYGSGARLELKNGNDARFSDLPGNRFRNYPERGYLVKDGTQLYDEHAQYNADEVMVELHPCYALGENDKFSYYLAEGNTKLIEGGFNEGKRATNYRNMIVLQVDGYYLRDFQTSLDKILKRTPNC